MSEHERLLKQAMEQRNPAHPQAESLRSPHADALHPEVSAGLAGLPRRLWQAGNAAISRLLGRQRRGQPLDPPMRMALEQSFGADFGHVHLHADATAQATAGALDAQAVTQGEDIYLGVDAPAPESPAGTALVAHELAHVVQQRQAGVVDADQMSHPGDQSEQAAEGAAQQAMQGQPVQMPTSGTPPALQRQERQRGVSRAQVQAALTAYLERVRTAQGGQSLRVTPEVRATVEQIFMGDVGGSLAIQAWLQGMALPGDPAAFAAQVVRRLRTDTIDPARIAHLTAPAAHETPSRLERVRSLAERTASGQLPAPMQESSWRFDQAAKDLRRNEGTIGPYGLDVLRAGRILSGLPEALRTPPTPQPEARAYAAVEQALQQIEPNALMPAGVSGEATASYADARELARDLARRLDIAQQQGRTEVELHLGANYANVRDRGAIYSALQRIALLVRDALPHHAAGVTHINVYIGDRLATRIALSAASR